MNRLQAGQPVLLFVATALLSACSSLGLGGPTPTPAPTPIGGGSGRIAFVSDRDGNRAIYVLGIDGSGEARLTSNEADEGAMRGRRPMGGSSSPPTATATIKST